MKRKLYQLMLLAIILLGASLFVLQGCKKEEEDITNDDWRIPQNANLCLRIK